MPQRVGSNQEDSWRIHPLFVVLIALGAILVLSSLVTSEELSQLARLILKSG